MQKRAFPLHRNTKGKMFWHETELKVRWTFYMISKRCDSAQLRFRVCQLLCFTSEVSSFFIHSVTVYKSFKNLCHLAFHL